MPNKVEERPGTRLTGAKDRPWELRLWSGMTFGVWIRLLLRNRFAIAPSRWAMCLLICVFTLVNSFFCALQCLLVGRKISRTELVEDPVFIVGHWRSGTTLLHEYLARDPQNTCPDTFACFCPNHFAISGPFLRWWLWLFLPDRRPMDNMRVGLDRPQEDEFALCLLGAPSPYANWAFPNSPPPHLEYLDMRDVPPEGLAGWKTKLLWFLKCVTYKTPRRIVLKSPTHTGRIRILLEMFPEARFVHIVRDPFEVFPSTVNTWKRFCSYHGCQVPRYDGLDEFVFSNLIRMYEAFEEDRKLVPPGQLCDVRYEDLVADPVGQVQAIYERLNLGDFEAVRPAIETYVERTQGYKRNRFEFVPGQKEEIATRWRSFFERYGYEQTGAKRR